MTPESAVNPALPVAAVEQPIVISRAGSSPADDARCRMAEVYRKGTMGSVLAWRAASLLLVRLLFVLKPHMRDDG